MSKGLLEWATEQPAWVSDSLRRIAITTDYMIGDEDFACILQNVRITAGADNSAQTLTPLDATHIGNGAAEKRRAVIVQLGPVQNIDRLAVGQHLRTAPDGITLVYGENGSGKSGYTRIAKRLCRSLSVDELRPNVFATTSTGPMRVEVRYRVDDDEISTFHWDPATAPPSILKQISVFDSHNAQLYVDGDNKIAYLPRELALLERHGDLCQRMAQIFTAEAKSLDRQLNVPLPTGYTAGTSVFVALANLNTKNGALPTQDELQSLATLSQADRANLKALEAELASDPVALAATRHRAIKLLRRLNEVLSTLSSDLSNVVGEKILVARRELQVADTAERLAAKASFADEPISDVGGSAWRVLFDAARAFATDNLDEPLDRLPDTIGDLCVLCQEPLSQAGASRLTRFNDFVSGEASRRADQSRKNLNRLLEKIQQIIIPSIELVADSLADYTQISTTCGAIVEQITKALYAFTARRSALLDDTIPPFETPNVSSLVTSISSECENLEREVTELQNTAAHSTALDQKRKLLAELKDKLKLSHDLETVLQRHHDVIKQKLLQSCLRQVASRPISNQITVLRKLLVTEELEKRIKEEIRAFDLSHLPFTVSSSSSGGQSLFSVGLNGTGKIKNNLILSEGEQRALALACFLAEIGGDDARYGIIVDDPVCSLDHLRMRKVAQRLVAEAKKGRQVIIFTHNLVFFNEVASEAAREGESAPIIKSVVTKNKAQGFGIIKENSEPWVADLGVRITALKERIRTLKTVVDLNTDDYRRKAKDFYSDLRESWERAVEEVVLAKTVVRFVPDVMTGRLKEVSVNDEDYRTIFFAMKRASERCHDMPAGRNIPQPSTHEMEEDINILEKFCIEYKKRRKIVSANREKLEKPCKATLI
ncbi:AAA family ATPase [Acetobacter sp. UBA5411]|uniref:AAA family ATPase n=1 Tax=Acetobacter sp. UBA5411 TaxID=1945905 RepID=UPI0025BE1E0C|nr:AAA family ATPase [Acetobacter sp. UBA5411]